MFYVCLKIVNDGKTTEPYITAHNSIEQKQPVRIS